MANISRAQKTPRAQSLLAAARQLYQSAKRAAALQTFLAAATPLIAAIAVARAPGIEIWAALAGIGVPLLDVGVFDQYQRRHRNLAAKIQEEFDCEVLEIAWNDALVGGHAAPEDIYEASKSYQVDSAAPLIDWYPLAVDRASTQEARLICQRTNCWWDSKLRRRYVVAIRCVVALISTIVLMLSLVNGLSVEKLILAVLAPLSPTFLWAMRETQRQRDAAEMLDRLKEHGETLWRRVVDGTLRAPSSDGASRELQDAIFYRRCENPFVLDWVYKSLRTKFEEQMNVGAEAMLRELAK